MRVCVCVCVRRDGGVSLTKKLKTGSQMFKSRSFLNVRKVKIFLSLGGQIVCVCVCVCVCECVCVHSHNQYCGILNVTKTSAKGS